jgi:hypothetical protein
MVLPFLIGAAVVLGIAAVVGAAVAIAKLVDSGNDADKNFPAKPVGSPSGACPLAAKATSQDPKITTVSGPKDPGCGGFDWKVWFDLPEAAGKDGWVVQEITATFDAKNADGTPNFQKTYHYWEAWEVKSGKKATVWQDEKKDDNDDQYFSSSRPNTKGTTTYVGTAKFIEGPLPPDFKTNNPDTIAGILHSTTKKPDFWDGTGTRHNINSAWDCTDGKSISNVSGMAGDTKVP